MIKKLLGIVVLGLLLSGNAFANNLIGKQLQCTTSNSNIAGFFEYYKFINNDEVNNYFILKKDLKVTVKKLDYKVYPETIEIHWGDIKLFEIYRKNLKTSSGNICEIIKFDIQNRLKKDSKQFLENISKDNKI